MRSLAFLFALSLLACSSDDSVTPAGSSGTGGSAALICNPGQQIACACPGGVEGAQACNLDGTGYLSCECGSSGASGSSGTGGSGGTAGTGGSGGTGGSSGSAGTGGTGGTSAGSSGTGGTGGDPCAAELATICEGPNQTAIDDGANGSCEPVTTTCGDEVCGVCSGDDECIAPKGTQQTSECWSPCEASVLPGFTEYTCSPELTAWYCPAAQASFASRWYAKHMADVQVNDTGCALVTGAPGGQVFCCPFSMLPLRRPASRQQAYGAFVVALWNHGIGAPAHVKPCFCEPACERHLARKI